MELIPSEPRMETPLKEMADTVRRLMKRGRTLKEVAEVCCRDIAWLEKLLKENPE